MFGIKKAMVVAAVAGISALAPAVASADVWKVNGSTVGGPLGAQVEGGGSLSFTVNIGVLVTTTCDVAVTADVWNAGSPLTGAGQVTVFDPDETTCVVTGVPNCQVTAVSAATPWSLSTSGSSVTISGVSFTNTYANAGGTCALAGNRTISGSVTGTWDNSDNTLNFTNAAGLTAAGVGPAIVNGSAFLEEEGTGGVLTLEP